MAYELNNIGTVTKPIRSSSAHDRIAESNHRFANHLPLEQEILRVLLYFDIFHHPLTLEEIVAALPIAIHDTNQVKGVLATGSLGSIVIEQDGYYRLSASHRDLVKERLGKERRASAYLKIARLVGRMVAGFPFVRGVFVSGELSKGVASPHTDIDFVVVTAERRLWICRTLLIAFKKLFLLNSKKFFCINHMISEGHLEIEEKSFYSAVEAISLRPVQNAKLLQQYLQANAWLDCLMPNGFRHRADAHDDSAPSLLQRMMEHIIPSLLADRLELWLWKKWQEIWRRRYEGIPEEQRRRLFKSLPHISTAYGNDYERQVMGEWHRRQRQYGLVPATVQFD